MLCFSADFGHFVRVDFRDYFDIEPATNEGNCDYDYLEVSVAYCLPGPHLNSSLDKVKLTQTILNATISDSRWRPRLLSTNRQILWFKLSTNNYKFRRIIMAPVRFITNIQSSPITIKLIDFAIHL